MHETSAWHMKDCIDRYISTIPKGKVLEVGSRNVNAKLEPLNRVMFEAAGWSYAGADLVSGPNVDIVLEDPYLWDLENESFDAVISGQMLEHNEMFWLSVLEMMRVLKPEGHMIHIVPSRGFEHRSPQDCWRFYRDGMQAIAKWTGLTCIEATTDWSNKDLATLKRRRPSVFKEIPRNGLNGDGRWGDTVGVFKKEQGTVPTLALNYMEKLLDRIPRS